MRQREDRITVSIPARMRIEDGWRDVTVRNVSRRGMLVHAVPPPPNGAYVEIRILRLATVAKIVWARGQLAGVRLQDPLQLDAIFGIAQASGGSAPLPATAPRDPQPGLAARSVERAHRLQYVALMLAAAMVAGVLGWAVANALSHPFDAIRSELSGS